MNRRYEFRYNTQVGEVEYRERNSFHFYFNPINKRVLNSIALDAQAEGIPLWDRDISRYIYSNRIPVFNPLEDFLYHLPVWTARPYPRTGANRSLRKQALGGLVSPLVSQHGHALAWGQIRNMRIMFRPCW